MTKCRPRRQLLYASDTVNAELDEIFPVNMHVAAAKEVLFIYLSIYAIQMLKVEVAETQHREKKMCGSSNVVFSVRNARGRVGAGDAR